MSDTEYPRVIFRSGELDTKLTERGNGTSASKSACAKRDLSRYYDALERCLPTFTVQESLLLCAALNGVKCAPGTLYGNIAASDELASEKWDVDAVTFLERLNRLSNIESQAVIDAVERAWNAPEYSINLKQRVLLVGLAK